MRGNYFKLIFVLFFLTSLFCVFLRHNTFFVFAATTSDIDDLNKEIEARKEKIKELEKSMSVYQKKISQKQTEAVSLKNQLSILDNYIMQTKTDISLTEEKIKSLELQIRSLGMTISDKETLIGKQKLLVAKLIREINADKEKKFVEILLTSDNFSDFYGDIQYLESVYTDLGMAVKSLRLSKEELETKKKSQEAIRDNYTKLKSDLTQKKSNYLERQFSKKDLLAQTVASESQYMTLLIALKKQYQSIENEMRAYEDKIRKKLAEQEKLNSGSASIDWPNTNRYITATFHDPDYPYRRVFEHSGIDIRMSQGTAVKASGSGYVARAKRCSSSSCYSYVLIVHTGNLSTVYGHLSSISVADDQYVQKGDIIGYSGGTPGTVGAGPFVTGAHLHFETRLNGIPVDPQKYLP